MEYVSDNPLTFERVNFWGSTRVIIEGGRVCVYGRSGQWPWKKRSTERPWKLSSESRYIEFTRIQLVAHAGGEGSGEYVGVCLVRESNHQLVPIYHTGNSLSEEDLTSVIRMSRELGIPVRLPKYNFFLGVEEDRNMLGLPRKLIGSSGIWSRGATIGQIEEFVTASEAESKDGKLDPLGEFLKFCVAQLTDRGYAQDDNFLRSMRNGPAPDSATEP